MNESMDHVLADWLRDGPESGPSEGLERALAATRHVDQRPGWTFPERWLPMQLTMARTRSLRPLLAIVMIALLIVAMVAAALLIGSTRRPLPPPFGPAANGALVYAEDGDIYGLDPATGNSSAISRVRRTRRVPSSLAMAPCSCSPEKRRRPTSGG
jgi:hypothetical protein